MLLGAAARCGRRRQCMESWKVGPGEPRRGEVLFRRLRATSGGSIRPGSNPSRAPAQAAARPEGRARDMRLLPCNLKRSMGGNCRMSSI